MFPEKQKGCCKGSRGTRELFYIDQRILNESQTCRKNLTMAWINYKKAYDIVLQSWIIKCLKMYKISDEVINFIGKTMQTWRVDLTASGKSLAQVKIQRGIFQGDALYIFTNTSARAGYDTRSIFKRSLTSLNSEFSFSLTSCLTKAEEHNLSYYLPIAGGRIIGFIPFPMLFVQREMQLAWSRIWTRVAVSISYDDNHYTTGTSKRCTITVNIHNYNDTT